MGDDAFRELEQYIEPTDVATGLWPLRRPAPEAVEIRELSTGNGVTVFRVDFRNEDHETAQLRYPLRGFVEQDSQGRPVRFDLIHDKEPGELLGEALEGHLEAIAHEEELKRELDRIDRGE